MKLPLKSGRWSIEEAGIYVVLFGIPLFGSIVAVVGLRHYFAISGWGTILIGIIGACGTTVPFWVWLIRHHAKKLREFEIEQTERKLALDCWQQRLSDPIFGIPGSNWRPGERDNLESYSGMVPVSPKEPNACYALVSVHITPDGFTESQRQFYLRAIHDYSSLLKQIHSAINAAFRREFPSAGEFPLEVGLCSIEIGRDIEGKLEKAVLCFEYAQDEYVAIDFTGNRVNSVEFYM